MDGRVAADLTHDTGRGTQRGHKVDGSRPAEPVPTGPTVPSGPTVRSLAVNSWPQSGGDAYRADDVIVFTFDLQRGGEGEGAADAGLRAGRSGDAHGELSGG